MSEIRNCCEGGDVKKFNGAVAEFSRITPLDKVKTTLVCRIKDIFLPEEQITHQKQPIPEQAPPVQKAPLP